MITMSDSWQKGDFLISTERHRLDREMIHDFLARESYWAKGRDLEVVNRGIDNSLSFGIYHGRKQVGFGRVVTDYATFAWVADVFVVAEHRGQGLGKWLIQVMLSHPQLQGFRRWALSTRDAHELYRIFGFNELARPERWMERPDPNMRESPDYWQKAPQ